jgi:hypothetical protein
MTNQESDAMRMAYLALGRLIAGECPAGFGTASLHVETCENVGGLRISAEQPDGTKVQLQPRPEMAEAILESLRGIRDAMPREGGAVWRSCIVILKAGGGFAMEVQY